MNDDQEKLSITPAHLNVVALMTVACGSVAEARESVQSLSPKACKRLLSAAVDIGGLLLRYDARAAERGGAASATELFTAIADGISDEFTPPPSTLH